MESLTLLQSGGVSTLGGAYLYRYKQVKWRDEAKASTVYHTRDDTSGKTAGTTAPAVRGEDRDGTLKPDWSKMEPKARRYVGEKNAAGRYPDGERMFEPKPTWDMLDEKEIVPWTRPPYLLFRSLPTIFV